MIVYSASYENDLRKARNNFYKEDYFNDKYPYFDLDSTTYSKPEIPTLNYKNFDAYFVSNITSLRLGRNNTFTILGDENNKLNVLTKDYAEDNITYRKLYVNDVLLIDEPYANIASANFLFSNNKIFYFNWRILRRYNLDFELEQSVEIGVQSSGYFSGIYSDGSCIKVSKNTIEQYYINDLYGDMEPELKNTFNVSFDTRDVFNGQVIYLNEKFNTYFNIQNAEIDYSYYYVYGNFLKINNLTNELELSKYDYLYSDDYLLDEHNEFIYTGYLYDAVNGVFTIKNMPSDTDKVTININGKENKETHALTELINIYYVNDTLYLLQEFYTMLASGLILGGGENKNPVYKTNILKINNDLISYHTFFEESFFRGFFMQNNQLNIELDCNLYIRSGEKSPKNKKDIYKSFFIKY
jgi:hypothetical protein